MNTNQGENSGDVFHGRSNSSAIQAFYKDSAPLFAKLIRKNMIPGRYSVADFGGHKGELLSELIRTLPEYDFDPIILEGAMLFLLSSWWYVCYLSRREFTRRIPSITSSLPLAP
jgi:hypothetical protein